METPRFVTERIFMANLDFSNILAKFKTAAFSTVIFIDTDNSQIKFMSIVGRDKNKIALDIKPYRTKPFDEEFFERFTQCLREYAQANPSYAGKAAAVTVVLPDYLIATDSINVPGVKKSGDMLDLAIDGKYKNLKELNMKRFAIAANKQYSTWYLSAIRTKLLQSIYTSCATSNMFADKITFAASALANSGFALNARLRNSSFVLLDIKEASSRFSLVNKGVTTGAYDMSFGYDILKKDKLTAENMLFDHSSAELMVLNAKEKAKAKELTMMSGDAAAQMANETVRDEQDAEESDEAFSSADSVNAQRQTQIKTLPRKTPRVLPKYMQRPVPEDHEGIVYENFRYFIKWTLDLIRANDRLTAISPFEAVYVNMPKEFDFLIDKTNEEMHENKVRFAPAGFNKDKQPIYENPEMYGGFFVNQFNRQNNF